VRPGLPSYRRNARGRGLPLSLFREGLRDPWDYPVSGGEL